MKQVKFWKVGVVGEVGENKKIVKKRLAMVVGRKSG
jgi:hypothetical protein